ncbi:hypothetical protein BHU72_00830 [Desulfuribacillus stibiiarsenatis]|uniref:ATP-grasp domain-containing protein n=2 Tax=Desulfuribacillus stibiiarsenatis TaxID=1390249 RepID=A0A1E5LA24_9FIRM|nr:hypothetical protein BHU72_00830 [Desulfuribacillus stibiiarsenatis]
MGYLPLIGIMVSTNRGRIYALKRYQQPYNLDMRVFAFTPKDINWKSRRINGVSWTRGGWKKRSFPFPDAVYNRCYNKTNTINNSIEKAIGKKCFNMITCFNKWIIYNMLKNSQMEEYLPNTFLYHEVNVANVLEQYKLMYLKPVYGSQGINVNRIELVENGEILISSHSLPPRYIIRENEGIQEKLSEVVKQKSRYILQEGISPKQIEHSDYDLRVLVQKNMNGEWEATTISNRVAYDNYFNTSIYKAIYNAEIYLPEILFNKEEGERILQELKEVSVKVASILDYQIGLLGELSVDFMLGENNKLKIIEVNGRPQKNIYDDIEDLKNKDIIYKRPLEYAWYLSRL